jgi:hypothetical protein
VDFGVRLNRGRALALIDLDEDISKYQVPLGATAEAAIYTPYRHHLSAAEDPTPNAQLGELCVL